MNKELQLLYMKLAPEDRDKVAAKIYELLATQNKSFKNIAEDQDTDHTGQKNTT